MPAVEKETAATTRPAVALNQPIQPQERRGLRLAGLPAVAILGLAVDQIPCGSHISAVPNWLLQVYEACPLLDQSLFRLRRRFAVSQEYIRAIGQKHLAKIELATEGINRWKSYLVGYQTSTAYPDDA